ncbi:MAG: transposase [Clostridiales bacterium]|jgi:transposase|nr:transposase [Eubacteriales bacterium]MDH7566204.1 transposase [Clostridiales bacterium]
MQALLNCCCGVDVHRDMIEVCILKGKGKKPNTIREQFKTTQSGLIDFVNWLYGNGCSNIAMESTGVYWIPVYEAIEEHLKDYEQLLVVNAHHMRNLPGRKKDVKDAEWIATLLRHGLLTASFIPDREIRNLREYSRLHKSFVQERSRDLNRLEKFLQTHGFKLSSVLSNIMGLSGRNLLNTLVEKGCITSSDVLSAVGRRIKRPLDEIESAVCGKLTRSECRLLELLLKKLDDCQKDIDTILADMEKLSLPYQKESAQSQLSR